MPPASLHKNLPPQHVHQPHSFEYAGAVARNAATGFIAEDVGKWAYQVDNGTFWRLQTVAPTWLQIGGGVTDHGNLFGLGDDDHLQYALLSPTLSTRNLLQGTTPAVTPLTIRGRVSQSVPLLSIQDTVPGPAQFGLGLLLGSSVGSAPSEIAQFLTGGHLWLQGSLRLGESGGPTGEYVGFKAPASLTTSQLYTLPVLDGTVGQVLSTSGGGAGVLSWITPPTATNFWTRNTTTIGQEFLHPAVTTDKLSLGVNTSPTVATQLYVQPTVAARQGLLIQGAANQSVPLAILQLGTTQTGNFLEFRDAGASTPRSYVNPLGIYLGWGLTLFGGGTILGSDQGHQILMSPASGVNTGFLTLNPVTDIGDAGRQGVMVPKTPFAGSNYGLLSLGLGPWNGTTPGFFSGSVVGTYLAINAPTAYAGNHIDIQRQGTRVFRVAGDGQTTIQTLNGMLKGVLGVVQVAVPGTDYEPGLGNPSTSGWILSSTTAGVRSWIAPPTGGGGVTDHGALTGLTPDDDHTQYLLLAGRAGGQVASGGTLASQTLTWQSTAHATKGKILFGTSAYDDLNNRLGLATATPAHTLDVNGTARVGTLNGMLKGVTGVVGVAVAGTDYELPIGNPGTNGFILSSTTAGVRSWIAPPITVHAGLTGLSADDHIHYLHLAPGTTARNVVTPTAPTVVPLTLKGAGSQSANLLEVRDSANVEWLNILPGGHLWLLREVRWGELASNGVNYVGFKASDALAGNVIWTLPAADGADGQFMRTNGAGLLSWADASTGGGVTDHGALSGLTPDDDHSQYLLLAGRAGGQIARGGLAASENLTWISTAHSTKGKILFGNSAYDEANNRLGIGRNDPRFKLDVADFATVYRSTATPRIRIETDATDDALLEWLIPSVRSWSMGIDNSDADKLKLSSVDDGFLNAMGIFGVLGADPLVRFGSTGASDAVNLAVANGSGEVTSFVAGGAGNYMSGTLQGEAGFRIGSGKALHFGITGVSWGMWKNASLVVGTTTQFASAKLQVTSDGVLSGIDGPMQLALTAANTNKRMVLGFDPTLNQGFINAGESGVAMRDIIVQQTGGNVNIGTPLLGAKLGVVGANSGGAVAVKIQKGTSSSSALDVILDNTFKAARFFPGGATNPATYLDDRGGWYSTEEMVLSGTTQGTGDSWAILAPTGDPTTLAISSVANGPVIQAKAAAQVNSYLFSGLDRNGNYTVSLEEDGGIRWGAGTRAAMDCRLFRSAAATLRSDETWDHRGKVLITRDGAALDNGYAGALTLTRAAANTAQYLTFIRSATVPYSFGMPVDTSTFGLGIGQLTDANFNPFFRMYPDGRVAVGEGDSLSTGAALKVVSTSSMPRAFGLPTIFSPEDELAIPQPDGGMITWRSDTSRIRKYTGSEWTDLESDGVTLHGALLGLEADDHLQYVLQMGRDFAQLVTGGTQPDADLVLRSTSHATRGLILMGSSAYDEKNQRFGIRLTNPQYALDVNGDVRFSPALTGIARLDAGVLSIDPAGGGGGSNWIRNVASGYLATLVGNDRLSVGQLGGFESSTYLNVFVPSASSNTVCRFGKGTSLYFGIGNNGSVGFGTSPNIATANQMTLSTMSLSITPPVSPNDFTFKYGGALTGITLAASPSFVIKVEVNGQTYYQPIYAAAGAGSPPAAPISLTANAVSSTQINLQWSDQSSDETGFAIERSPDGSTGWAQIDTVGANVTTYNNTGLTSATQYFYRVRAFNGNGNSAYSNTANATTTGTAPGAPTVLIATTASSSQIDLQWTDNASNETGFSIERSPDGSTGWAEIATVGANVTTYSNTGLTASTTYHYRVRAFNAVGNSAYSNVANATTSASGAGAISDNFNRANQSGLGTPTGGQSGLTWSYIDSLGNTTNRNFQINSFEALSVFNPSPIPWFAGAYMSGQGATGTVKVTVPTAGPTGTQVGGVLFRYNSSTKIGYVLSNLNTSAWRVYPVDFNLNSSGFYGIPVSLSTAPANSQVVEIIMVEGSSTIGFRFNGGSTQNVSNLTLNTTSFVHGLYADSISGSSGSDFRWDNYEFIGEGGGGGGGEFSDTFDRPNSTTSLGTATNGQTWTAQSGTWGISNNQAYWVGGGGVFKVATLGGQTANATVECDFSTLGASMGLILRWNASTNTGYLVTKLNAGGARYRVWEISQTSPFYLNGSPVGSFGSPTAANGDRVRCILSGTTGTFAVDTGAGYGSGTNITLSLNSTSVLHGIGGEGDTTARFDDFNTA